MTFLKKQKKGVSLSTNHVKGVKMYFVRSIILLTGVNNLYIHFKIIFNFFCNNYFSLYDGVMLKEIHFELS